MRETTILAEEGFLGPHLPDLRSLPTTHQALGTSALQINKPYNNDTTVQHENQPNREIHEAASRGNER